MRIQKLTTYNFQGLAGKHIFDLSSPLYLVADKNGTGKSSFLNAFRYALTGVEPSGGLRTLGSGGTAVTLETEDGKQYTRQKKKGGTAECYIGQAKSGVKAFNTSLAEHLGVTEGILRVISSGEVLAAMKPQEFESFLLGYMKPVNTDDILAWSGLEESDQEQLKSWIGKPDVVSADLDALYKKCYKMRTTLNRELTAEGARITADAKRLTPPQKKREEYETAWKELLEKQKAAARYVSELKAYEKAVADQKQQQEMRSSLQKQMEALPKEKPDPKEKDRRETEKTELEEQQMTAQKNIASFESLGASLKKALETLNQPVCPLSEKLKCTTDKSGIQSELQESIKNAEASAKKEKKRLDTIAKKLAKNAEVRSALEKQQMEYDRREAIAKQLEALEKMIHPLPEKPQEPTEKDIDNKVVQAKKELDNFDEYTGYIAAKKDFLEKRKHYRTVDVIVNAIAPKGPVREKMTETFLQNFEAACNERAKTMGEDMEIRFLLKQGIHVYAKIKAGAHPIPFESLSAGEKIRTLFVLMDLMAEMSGYRVLVMDELSVLDPEGFAALLDTLLEHKDMYDNALLCMVNHEGLVKEAKKRDIPVYTAVEEKKDEQEQKQEK